MNKQEADILKTLMIEPFINQRILAEESGHSLGVVNRSIKSLIANGYLNQDIRPTLKAAINFKNNTPKNAIILAAGFGMRMVPINTVTPKALLEVNGEILIERQIRQLHEAGIYDIIVVVGFMKEKFDYLIDKYSIKLVVNSDYATKNNLSSLYLVVDRISNTYIVPCDIWCDLNPFERHELYSWYMVSDLVDNDSDVRVNRKLELVQISQYEGGNAMIGITYLIEKEASIVRDRIKRMMLSGKHDGDFWEKALYNRGKMIIPAKIVHATDIIEINTYEQLRDLDGHSKHLKSDELATIANVLNCKTDEISNIDVLKKGMTNKSFIFSVKNKKYIMRIPGEGTGLLINRKQEVEVFKTISGLGFCDDPVYINPQNGYKITAFLDNARVCDAADCNDLKRCMKKLKNFHEMKLKVEHKFDIFKQIDFYESLWNGIPSAYSDYLVTKSNVFSLREFIAKQKKDWCLTHIDAVCDNFLFYKPEGEEEEKLQLTDWEYSGMQDPHVDIAMFAIYSLYNKEQVDQLISIYFEREPDTDLRAKIYCYIAACGLLWSNWTEYKSLLGIEFGEYGLRQYRFAKDYYKYAISEIKKSGEIE